jgi:hypothetical protein
MAAPKVFLSYSHRDRDIVRDVIKRLDHEQINYWDDRQLRGGDRWSSVIEHELLDANVFVVVVTPSFLASPWSMMELGAAVERARQGGVAIIPIIAGQVQVPAILEKYEPVSADAGTAAELVERIRNLKP